jgi:hypothetical protein
MTAPGAYPPQWPDELTANAWTGAEAASGELAADARFWAVSDHFAGRRDYVLAPDKRPDLKDWADTRVGWGLVLPDDPALSNAERERAEDCPRPARELAQARSRTAVPVVLRYHPDDEESLYRYEDGAKHPLPITGEGPRGTGRGGLPYYLLLLGPPDRLPWELQFRLNLVACTGRLDLDETGLGNYVRAALSSWSGSAATATSPLLWTVQHQQGDITWLMRQSVGERIFRRWQGDRQIGAAARALRDGDATIAQLRSALLQTSPGVVVTTSHGMTGPLHDMAQMRSTLGRLAGARTASCGTRWRAARPAGPAVTSSRTCSRRRARQRPSSKPSPRSGRRPQNSPAPCWARRVPPGPSSGMSSPRSTGRCGGPIPGW